MNNITIKMSEYGQKINEQELGTDIFLKNQDHDRIILDFENVLVVSTPFFNSFISEIIKYDKNLDLKDKFGIRNANEQIKNNLLISLELAKYYD